MAEATFHATGAALPELFENVAALLLSELTDVSLVGSTHREKVVVEGAGREALLGAWVNALLALPRVQKVIYRHCLNGRLEERPAGLEWRCDVIGELVDRERHFLNDALVAGVCREVIFSSDPLTAVIRIERAQT